MHQKVRITSLDYGRKACVGQVFGKYPTLLHFLIDTTVVVLMMILIVVVA